jgi:putative DNA primase/helicase
MNYINSFRDAIAAAGLTPPTEIIDDGKKHRFSSSGKPRDMSGWYILHGDDRPAGVFGCWRQSITVNWKHDAPQREFTPAEREAWKERMRRLESERLADREEAERHAAKTAATMWDAGRDDAAHEYLTRKKIPCLGARVLKDMLLVPMKHSAKALVGLQRIYPDGTKLFIKGSPLAGAYCTIGKPTASGPIVIVEGYATGISVHLATQYCVVVAFNAGNLEAVARKIRAVLPVAAIIIGADDDAWTDGNPGVTSATAAALAIGAVLAVPRWSGDRPEKRTDFNDLHLDEGLEAVAECFRGAIGPKPDGEPNRLAADRLRTAQPDSGGENSGSSWHGAPPSPVEAVVQEHAPGPVIMQGGGGDVQILPPISDQLAPDCSDDDLAGRHLQRMQKNTLWCEMWGRWLVWNGDRWLRDETNMVLDVVRQTCRQSANDVLSNPELDSGKRQRQADKIASFRTITNVERLARTYRSVATHPDEWDRDLWALNTPSGVVNLRTGVIRAHTSDDRFTKITAVAPGGDCPTWMAFLNRATGGNEELIGFLRRMCGYALTGEVREHALFFVYGTGGNGKGTFLNTITHIMGDYQRVSGSETFTESPGDRHTTELARLQGARLVTAQETEEGKRWAESRIKSLTGGDPITARFMRQDDFTFIPQFKLVIVGNHKPSFRSVDEAIKRRLHLVPFTAEIPASEKDPLLADKLKAEAPGILQWMIDGCLEWERNGLKPPQVVKESTEEYLGAEDSLQQWIDECCDVGSGFATSKALFYSWSKWCDLSGEYVGTMKRLMAKLESRGIATGQKFKGARGCIGIKIKSDDEEYESNPY